jgi:biopolymer transport protein ExbB/TolQ
LALLIERTIYYTQLKKALTRESEEFFGWSKRDGVAKAYCLLEGRTGILPDLLRAAWSPEYTQMSLVERNVEEVLHENRPHLEKSLNTLATLASIQPLLGLLGTISGMIATFSVISTQGTGDPRALADGISEAMITTEAGLCVALPILLAHNYLRNRYKNILASLQKFCARSLKEKEQHGAA